MFHQVFVWLAILFPFQHVKIMLLCIIPCKWGFGSSNDQVLLFCSMPLANFLWASGPAHWPYAKVGTGFKGIKSSQVRTYVKVRSLGRAYLLFQAYYVKYGGSGNNHPPIIIASCSEWRAHAMFPWLLWLLQSRRDRCTNWHAFWCRSPSEVWRCSHWQQTKPICYGNLLKGFKTRSIQEGHQYIHWSYGKRTLSNLGYARLPCSTWWYRGLAFSIWWWQKFDERRFVQAVHNALTKAGFDHQVYVGRF